MQPTNVLALDFGGKRVGMAVANTSVKVPRLLPTLIVDDSLDDQIRDIVTYEGVDTIVVGYPRNLSGEPTAQSATVEAFVSTLKDLVDIPVVVQDESLTSIRAEEILRERGKPYAKADIDAEAAALILQDYLESQ